ncbi:MAG: ATP synthase subunit C [Thaumarchaeota archaeon]|nr:ATP synthase subunit C [Candidatus Calditenuaceae archaeon]MDW8187465.1 ATP synthase subunit C [Nitrososphaerota archaeon]
MRTNHLILLALLGLLSIAPAALAAEAAPAGLIDKSLSAAIAFAVAVAASGFAISRAGSAGLAASAERPELRTVTIIIAAFAEALAIYGIAIAFVILTS